ncbi:DUF4019 domain-containing protein [Stenotrophomonas sp. 24(2023)]|uniref:DUF4019 domain-containing protein n=1 Tax=Stenotrophomonas sp. 24(2023) TaxID=3068324 RepID=UPI0027DF352D|nr:DUF4019 domain-containing protein [Stenotrophomonas sp. 24(2023)]WMJ68456.1 DUF4019 domain-containing protein [Stenotrophomonas sp. 24(2023)]
MKRSALLLFLLLPLPLPLLAQTLPPPATPAPAPARPAPTAAPAHPALPPAQQAQVQKQDAEMSAAGLRVAQMVDGHRAAELWEGASAVAKKAVNKAAFIGQLDTDRGRLGALVGRGEPSVTRVKYGAGAAVPEGLYINVSFPTRFANSAQPVRELVSFRFDEDKVWRLAGYSVRAPGP